MSLPDVDGARRVMYRMETTMAVDRKLLDTPLLLRISIAAPTFPLDEATLHNPSLYETTGGPQPPINPKFAYFALLTQAP